MSAQELTEWKEKYNRLDAGTASSRLASLIPKLNRFSLSDYKLFRDESAEVDKMLEEEIEDWKKKHAEQEEKIEKVR